MCRIFATVTLLSLIAAFQYNPRFQYSRSDPDISCHCVLPHLCADDDVAVNGHGLLEPRQDGRKCSNYPEVCCDILITEPTKPPQNKLSSPPSTHCGISNFDSMKTRMTSGSTTTKFGELPWNLIILEGGDDNQKDLYKCGASLIHPQVAITAAHCVFPNVHNIRVRAGEWDMSNTAETLPHQETEVDEIIVHPNYNSHSLRNDIAILFLEDSFVLADNVALMCLPNHETKVLGNNCVASGWGKSGKNGRYTSVLKMVEMPIVPREKCLTQLRQTRLGQMYNLDRSFVCAGGERNKDTCKGDGGGPLICPVKGYEEKFVQVGIVSWGIGCGEERVPGVYVNVALYHDWIDEELGYRNLDTTFYKV